jgi:hypothetical protein
LAEGLDMFRLVETIATGGNMNPSSNVLYEKDFGWMYVWELNPEG